ncbi:hypothetical protein F5882DRAFT_288283, partial [Hyaloscypha sp. PMI_1271]
MPTRLFNLRTGEVVQTPTKVPYCALSYVWGQEPISTTIATAAEACLELGVEWLWVDQKCILQDNDDDKAKEVPRMAQYYTDAHATLI